MCNMRTIGQAVSEKKIFEIVDDGRTTEHGYTISSPMSLRLRLAKRDLIGSFDTYEALSESVQTSLISKRNEYEHHAEEL